MDTDASGFTSRREDPAKDGGIPDLSRQEASLGSMCSEALSGLKTYPYRLFIPAVILSVMILSLNLFGDGLRDALDPKLKK